MEFQLQHGTASSSSLNGVRQAWRLPYFMKNRTLGPCKQQVDFPASLLAAKSKHQIVLVSPRRIPERLCWLLSVAMLLVLCCTSILG